MTLGTTSRFQAGEKIATKAGGELTIINFIGAGGQGSVYRVSYQSKEFALKWYHPENSHQELYASLQKLIIKGAPSKHFLWPLELTEWQDGRFGYLMELRPSRFTGLAHWLIDPVSVGMEFSQLAVAGYQLAVSFEALHAQGMAYQDISQGNVFFDPQSGEVLICDNDNVTAHGSSVTGIYGTPGFMAPEVARGEAQPDSHTDKHSLAVLLFMTLTLARPFDGLLEHNERCLDEATMLKLYGTQPVFIFNPKDASNRPVPGAHDNAIKMWPLYPRTIQELFLKTFTSGLRDPQNGRARNTEWMDAFLRLMGSIVVCPHGHENIILPGSGVQRCYHSSCQMALNLPPQIRIGNYHLYLRKGLSLYAEQIGDVLNRDLMIGTVVSGKRDSQRLGIQNLSATTWAYRYSDQENYQDATPETVIAVRPGLTIDFGKCTGNIV